MEKDLSRALERFAAKPAEDLRRRVRPAEAPEWRGTGLCPEAQADGVPCPGPSCSCDSCQQAGGKTQK